MVKYLLFPSLAISLALSGCPTPNDSLCDDVECDSGYSCEEATGRCIQPRLEPIEGTPPGKSVHVDFGGGRAFVASIDSASGHVVAGEITRNTQDIRVLYTLSRPRVRIALDASEERVAVAWLGEEGRYLIAWRPVGESNAYWDFIDVEADRTYAGTENFDISLADGEPMLAFQAPDRTLKVLKRRRPLEAFALTTVDDGSVSANGIACPNEIRESERVGVGKDPDLLISPDGTAYLVYQDADCGDLRVAKQVSGTWSVDVVDTGAFDTDTGIEQRGRVGEYASIALEPGGRAAIAYFDASRGQLKYARGTERGWELQVVDRGLRLDEFARERKDIVGTFSSLSFDDLGIPRIVYMNGSTLELRVAERSQDGSRWITRTLASEGVVGLHADHAFSTQLGSLTVAERLVPGPDGPISELVTLWE